jgi:DNA-directed RNA polymerase subunit beta'
MGSIQRGYYLEFGGIAKFDSIEEGVTFRIERDDQTGYAEKVIVESKNKRKIPTVKIISRMEKSCVAITCR